MAKIPKLIEMLGALGSKYVPEENIDRDKTLKAADMLSKFISDSNKG